MLSISVMAGGQGNYYADLAREDYYLAGGEPSGFWLGEGAKTLGLSGTIQREQFLELFDGFQNGEKLVQNAGNERHRPGWDLTFSAPKSVSTAWSQADLETQLEIQAAHMTAVEKAAQYLEDNALWTRKGKAGVDLERCRGVIATFEHGTSRAQDPQLHTHALLLNIGVGEDGKTRSLETRAIYLSKMVAGALYRSELAYQLERRLGLFAVARDKDTSFDLKGVSVRLTDHFSSRRKEILAALEAKGLKSSRAAEFAALDTRGVKGHISRKELFEKCRAAGKELGWSRGELESLMNGRQRERVHGDALHRACLGAIENITQGSAYFTEREIIRRVAEASQTLATGAKAVQDAVRNHIANSQQIVKLGHRHKEAVYSTKEMLALEGDLMHMAKKGAVGTWGWVSEAILKGVKDGRPTMSDEQKRALRHITQKTGSIACVTGMAGTGKTFMLGATREALELSGYTVIGAALSGKAAEGLEEGSKIKSSTIASFLKRLVSGNQKLDSKTVVVLDEAGMIGTRQLHEIASATTKGGAKLLLVGDEKQLQPIDAGGPFRAISKAIGTVELTNIVRQKDEWQRQAVKDFAYGEATKGLKAYAERGFVSVSEDRQAARDALLTQWKKAGLKSPENNLIVTATNADAKAINQKIQALRLEKDGRENSASVTIGGQSFFAGDRILFTKNSNAVGVKNGTIGTITSVGKKVTVRLDGGDRRTFSPTHYDHVKLGYAVTTHKSQGATVDNVFILTDECMQDRQLTYVQASRCRNEAKFFTTEAEAGDQLKGLAKTMERSNEKILATDFGNSSFRDGGTQSDREETERKKEQEKKQEKDRVSKLDPDLSALQSQSNARKEREQTKTHAQHHEMSH